MMGAADTDVMHLGHIEWLHAEGGRLITLDTREARELGPEVLAINAIVSDR
jgi:hypothetical protein